MPRKNKTEVTDATQPTLFESKLIERLSAATGFEFQPKQAPTGRVLELTATRFETPASWLNDRKVPFTLLGSDEMNVIIDVPQGNYPELASALDVPLSQSERVASLQSRQRGNKGTPRGGVAGFKNW